MFDDIDEEGNAKPGALNRVYVATRDFIKGITDIVGTDKFKDYVTKLGNAIGDTIQSLNHFGVAWKLAFSKSFLFQTVLRSLLHHLRVVCKVLM